MMKWTIIKQAIVPIFLLLVLIGLAIKAFMPVHAPSFAATTVDNRQLSSDELTGSPWYVEFWSVSCSTCLADFDELIRLHQQLVTEGGQVIAIAAPQDDKQSVIKLSKPLIKAGILVIDDEKGELANAFSHHGVTPYGFLVTPKGYIAHIHAGKLQTNIIMNALQ